MILPVQKATGDRVHHACEGCFLRQGSFEEVFDSDDPRIKKFYTYNFIEDS